MKLIATRSDGAKLYETDSSSNQGRVVLEDGTSYDVNVLSALVRGYWEEVEETT
jgi:hypothetical protein